MSYLNNKLFDEAESNITTIVQLRALAIHGYKNSNTGIICFKS
jgi:hypothetical protein